MRGVEKVDCDRRLSEAVVTRIKGQAPGSELVRAVERAGYRARVIPTYRLNLDCEKIASEGGRSTIRRTLAGVRGVRGIGFPAATRAIVYYDKRRTSAARLLQLVKGQGCNRQG